MTGYHRGDFHSNVPVLLCYVLNAKGVSFEAIRKSHTRFCSEADAGVGCAVR